MDAAKKAVNEIAKSAVKTKVIKKTNYIYTRGGMKRKHYGEFKRKPSTVFLIQYFWVYNGEREEVHNSFDHSC